jgi:hypothetical protein
MYEALIDCSILFYSIPTFATIWSLRLRFLACEIPFLEAHRRCGEQY